VERNIRAAQPRRYHRLPEAVQGWSSTMLGDAFEKKGAL